MFATKSGIVMSVKPVQLAKASPMMFVTPAAIAIPVMFVHSKNAPVPTSVTVHPPSVSGIVRFPVACASAIPVTIAFVPTGS